MARRNRKRRKVEWLALGGPVAHAYVVGQNLSVCGAARRARVPEDHGSRPDECRPCAIALDQTW